MRVSLLTLLIFNTIFSWGQVDSGLKPPAKFTMYKPANIQIKTRKDIAHLITDSLENPKAYILGGIEVDSTLLEPISQWSIAVKRNNKFYVFYPFEKSTINKNGNEYENGIRSVRLKNIPIKQKGKQLIELSWESVWGYGSYFSGATYLCEGIQLWDFSTLTRHLDFLLMESSNTSSVGEGDYSCKEYQYEYLENGVRLIHDKTCWGSDRRKVNDTTVCYNYQLISDTFILGKVEPYIFFGEPATIPNLPEYLRMINCTSYDWRWFRDEDKNTVGFWFVNAEVKVPHGKTELLLHRSGKPLMLGEGRYTIADLNKLLQVNEPMKIVEKDYVFPCYYNSRAQYSSVFLPDASSSYVYSQDSIILFTPEKQNYRVALGDGLDVISEYMINSNKIAIKAGQLKPKEMLVVQISLKDQNQKWEYEYVLRPLSANDLKNFETGLVSYIEKVGDASEDFKTISRAYFFVEHGLLTEAHMLLSALYEKDTNNKFCEAAYFSFLKVNYEFKPFSK